MRMFLGRKKAMENGTATSQELDTANQTPMSISRNCATAPSLMGDPQPMPNSFSMGWIQERRWLMCGNPDSHTFLGFSCSAEGSSGSRSSLKTDRLWVRRPPLRRLRHHRHLRHLNNRSLIHLHPRRRTMLRMMLRTMLRMMLRMICPTAITISCPTATPTCRLQARLPARVNPTPNNPVSRCEQIQSRWAQLKANCEQSNWQTYECEQVLRTFHGCVDLAEIYPTPDGGVACAQPSNWTAAQAREEACRRRGMISIPDSDGFGHDGCQPPDNLGTLEQEICLDPAAMCRPDAMLTAELRRGSRSGPERREFLGRPAALPITNTAVTYAVAPRESCVYWMTIPLLRRSTATIRRGW